MCADEDGPEQGQHSNGDGGGSTTISHHTHVTHRVWRSSGLALDQPTTDQFRSDQADSRTCVVHGSGASARTELPEGRRSVCPVNYWCSSSVVFFSGILIWSVSSSGEPTMRCGS